MKRYIYTKINLSVLAMALVLFACDPEGDSFDVSTVTYFPSFELPDGASVVIETGEAFIPNAIVKEGETQLTPTISNGVDNQNPGIYEVTYSAQNSDGYSGSVSQRVIVYNPAVIPTDVTGNIADVGRPERKGVISLVPGTTNIFFCTDMGFAGVFPLYFEMNGDVMNVIPQPLAFGQTSVDGTYDPVTRRFQRSDTSGWICLYISIRINDTTHEKEHILPSNRTFVHHSSM